MTPPPNNLANTAAYELVRLHVGDLLTAAASIDRHRGQDWMTDAEAHAIKNLTAERLHRVWPHIAPAFRLLSAALLGADTYDSRGTA